MSVTDTFKIVKTNKFGKDQSRLLTLDFASGSIVNKNDKGKTMKEHHASSVLFVETEGMLDLIVHLPKKKEYRCVFVVASVQRKLPLPAA